MVSTALAAAPNPPVAVRLLVWGGTDRDVECALDHARQGWSRETWRITVERVPGPVDVPDGKEIAARHTATWGYVALAGYVRA
jgi:hypothetical protein